MQIQGAGAVTKKIAPLVGTIHAIDTSLSMLRTLAKTVDSPNVTHSLHGLSPRSAKEFEDRKPHKKPSANPADDQEIVPNFTRFDMAIANYVIHHVDDVEPFFVGLVGVVKPGGWVVITEFGLSDDKEEGLRIDQARVRFPSSFNSLRPRFRIVG